MCAKMSIATFARKYQAVMDALLRSLLELVCTYHRICAGCGPAACAQHSSHLLASPAGDMRQAQAGHWQPVTSAAAESDSAHACREGEMPQVQPSSVPAAMASPSGELATCRAAVSAAVIQMRLRIGSSTFLCQPVMYVGFRPLIWQ